MNRYPPDFFNVSLDVYHDDRLPYDEIGHNYGHTRREDPAIRDRMQQALGEARTVVNAGAGAGSYEPLDRHVIAVEPSDTMAMSRPARCLRRFVLQLVICRCRIAATVRWMRP